VPDCILATKCAGLGGVNPPAYGCPAPPPGPPPPPPFFFRSNNIPSRVFCAFASWWRHNGDYCRCLRSLAMIRPIVQPRIRADGGRPATLSDPVHCGRCQKYLMVSSAIGKRLQRACHRVIIAISWAAFPDFAVRFSLPLARSMKLKTVFAFIADSNSFRTLCSASGHNFHCILHGKQAATSPNRNVQIFVTWSNLPSILGRITANMVFLSLISTQL